MEVLFAIILMLLGAGISWVITHKYSKGSDNQIVSVETNVTDLINRLIENQSKTQLLLEQALSKVGVTDDPDIQNIIRDTEKLSADSLTKTYEAESQMGLKFKTEGLERTLLCPKCGGDTRNVGYKPTPHGWVIHFACPEHGQFPSGHIDDMMED